MKAPRFFPKLAALALSLSLLNFTGLSGLAEEGKMSAPTASDSSADSSQDASMDSMWADHSQAPSSTKAEEKKAAKTKGTAKKTDKKRKPAADETSQSKSDLAPSPAQNKVEQAKEEPPLSSEAKEVLTEKRSTALANPDSSGEKGEAVKAENVEAASAPLCAKADFLASELVKSTAWPGVGPFTSDSGGDYSDPQENKLSIDTKEDRVIAVELLLTNVKLDSQNFLNLEMTCDFMLEALGAKGRRIANFNKFLERNSANILGTEKNKKPQEAVYSTTNGPYLISLKSMPSDGSHAFLVQVKSKDASADLLKSHSLASAIKQPKTEEQPDETAVEPPVKAVKTGKATSNNSSTGDKSGKSTKSGQPDKTTTGTGASASPLNTSGDPLKKELGDVIVRWQQIKKAAVKDKDVTELPKILSGKALARQSDAVKWLATHKQHYEVELRGVSVDHVQLLSQSPRRYAVFANVKEASKVVMDDTNQVKPETTDSYNVNYTIERVGDHWSISDSLLLPKTGSKPAAKH